jgi:hypothetical protein
MVEAAGDSASAGSPRTTGSPVGPKKVTIDKIPVNIHVHMTVPPSL